MSPVELKAAREALGLTVNWLADHLGVQPRAVERWEAGARPVPEYAADAVELLVAEHDEQVEHQVDGMRGHAARGLPPLVAVDTTAPDSWPARWQRMVAWRAAREVPGARIVGDAEI